MRSELSRVAADAVVLLHVAFVAFVVLGGVLVLRWRRLAWLHLPAAAWGAAVEFGGWICPLTPLEVFLRRQGGATGYRGDFIEHYLLPLLYPARLDRVLQVILGCAVLAVNVLVYWRVIRARRSPAAHGHHRL